MNTNDQSAQSVSPADVSSAGLAPWNVPAVKELAIGETLAGGGSGGDFGFATA